MIYRILNFIFCFNLFLSIHYISAEKYVVEIPTEVIAESNNSRHCGISDEGEVLINAGQKYVIWAKNKNLVDLMPGISSPRFDKLCSNGTALGTYVDPSTRPLSTYWNIIWNSKSGVEKIDIRNDIPNFKYDHYANTISLIDMNSFGQLIGSYTTNDERKRVFLYQNGKTKDLNIDDELYACGYQVMNVYATQINDNGNIFGSFDYGYKHPLKNTWIKEGMIHFFWNGHVYLIDLPTSFQSKGMNNDDEILVWGYENYKLGEPSGFPKIYSWHYERGFSFLTNGFVHFNTSHPYNNCGQFFVDHDGKVLLFLKNGSYLDIPELLKGSDIKNPHNLSINNKGVIVGEGTLWGENHVFILRPEKSSKSQD